MHARFRAAMSSSAGAAIPADLDVGFGKVNAEESLTTLARTVEIIPRIADLP